MTVKKIIPILFVLIFNFWIYKIFEFSLLLAVAVILASISTYLFFATGAKKYLYISLVFLLVLMVYQYKTTSITPLTYLTEQERTEQRQRMTGYPRELYRFANWLEQRKEAVIFYKIEENFFDVVDPNFYFFANHPRERAGIVEYEKLPYIFLPFLLVGIYMAVKLGPNVLLLLSPILLLTFIGNNSSLGPFSLFPAIAGFIALGLKPVFNNRKYFIVFILAFSLVFIQTLSYATY